MKKNIIIDGDKFQKEYKKQYQKELITNLIQGIIICCLAGSGLFFGSKLLLQVVIYIFPIFILTYSINLLSLGLGIIKTNHNQGISFFIQALIFAIFAIYIMINPIKSLNIALVIIGSLIVLNAVIKMFYYPDYLPLGSFIGGGILILFSETLIDLFYTIVMLFLLLYGIGKIINAIYQIKEN